MDSKANVSNGESIDVSSIIVQISIHYICLCLGISINLLLMSLHPQGHDGVVTLCRYPFVFDAQAKTTLLQTDAVIQMQVIHSKSLK